MHDIVTNRAVPEHVSLPTQASDERKKRLWSNPTPTQGCGIFRKLASEWEKCAPAGPQTLGLGRLQRKSVSAGTVKVVRGRSSWDIRCRVLCLRSTLTAGLTVRHFRTRHPLECPCNVGRSFEFLHVECPETKAAVAPRDYLVGRERSAGDRSLDEKLEAWDGRRGSSGNRKRGPSAVDIRE